MQIPRSYIDNYSKSLNVLSEQAQARLADALGKIDYSADIADIRNAVIDVMQVACGASTQLAARFAAEFYNGLRSRFMLEEAFTAIPDSRRKPIATGEAVRAFVQVLVDDKPREEFINKCIERIDYETRRAANECVAYNARKDPKKPRWARVPKSTPTIYMPWSNEPGVTHNKELAQKGTCPFCLMLASRGFVYHSSETASHAHPGCDCRVVPSWDKKPTVKGYSPDKYYDQWIAGEYEQARDASEEQEARAGKDLGAGGKFRDTGIGGMNEYLRSSKNIDELYKRADEVLKDINSRWNGDKNMFRSASRTAKEMRNVLS